MRQWTDASIDVWSSEVCCVVCASAAMRAHARPAPRSATAGPVPHDRRGRDRHRRPTPVKRRRRPDRRRLDPGHAGHGIPAARSERRRRADASDRRARGVRRDVACTSRSARWSRSSDRLVGMLTRRDEGSPSDWVRVVVRLVPRSADGVRILRQRRRREAGSLLVRRHEQRRRLGRRLGRRRARAAPITGGGIQDSRSRSCVSIRPAAARSASRCVRTIAHENETTTWPLLARSASGYVSSFGDLTGLAFPAAPKKLELLPYALGAD